MGNTESGASGSLSWRDEIRVIVGEGGARDQIIDLLASAISQDAEFLYAEGYPGILEEWIPDSLITLTEGHSRIHVDVAPRSGEGHDASFSIDKATGLLDRGSLAVGEVIPPPFEDPEWE